jgi:ribosomal protein L21E
MCDKENRMKATAWIGQRGKIGQTPTNDKENNMKAGDLVRMNEEYYPKYKGKVGVLVEERRVDCFVVSVDGKDHPFFIHRTSMEKVN